MRKLVYIFVILLGIMACSKKKDGVSYWPSYKDDPVRKRVVREAKAKEEAERPKSMEERDAYLDSMTAEGEGVIIYESDREYDTIIDHIRYIYVKAKRCDTPVDSTKHPELFIQKR